MGSERTWIVSFLLMSIPSQPTKAHESCVPSTPLTLESSFKEEV